jgi:hypothetical protein
MDKIAIIKHATKLREENPEMTFAEAMKISVDLKNKLMYPESPKKEPKTFSEKKKSIEKFYNNAT